MSTDLSSAVNATTRALLFTTFMFLAGCGGGGNVSEPPPPPDAKAQQMLGAGQFQAAAAEYLRLVKGASPSDAALFRSSAAASFVLANNFGAARQALAQVPASGLGGPATVRAALVRARLAAAENRPQDALATLPSANLVPPAFARIHVDTRVASLREGDDPVTRARAHTDLEPYLTDPTERSNNNALIWKLLSGLPGDVLESAKSPTPDALTGWLELVEIGRLYAGDTAGMRSALDVWRIRFPAHPAGPDFGNELLARTERLARKATHVALMLPLSGRFERAGAAVRDGFVGAWVADAATRGIHLTVIDTVNRDAVELYRSATANGADFVVGPLRKELLQALVTNGAISVPTLALNAYQTNGAEAAPPADLYQLALSPELEAEEVARKVWFDGHQNAVVIAPSNDWGERVTGAFAAAFSELGGRVLETSAYDAESRDPSEPVKQLLNIDHSEQRIKELQRVVRVKMESDVRRRQDVDAIFMAGFSTQARVLRPQLRFHRASGVPVYATSHVYGGVPAPERDRDIDGVVFGDMPWMVDPRMQDDPLIRDLNENWAETMAGFARLFALGADAQALVSRLGPLRAQPGTEYAGYTGALSVRPDNVVQRKLSWARFRSGVVETADAGFSQGSTSEAQNAQ